MIPVIPAGASFVLRTDHGCLTWFCNFKNPEGQLARWLEALQEYDFEVMHHRGKIHSNSDSLSRIPCRHCGRLDEDLDAGVCIQTVLTDLALVGREREDIHQLQAGDPEMKRVISAMDSNHLPLPGVLKGTSRRSQRLFQLRDQLSLQGGVLFRHYVGANDAQNRM